MAAGLEGDCGLTSQDDWDTFSLPLLTPASSPSRLLSASSSVTPVLERPTTRPRIIQDISEPPTPGGARSGPGMSRSVRPFSRGKQSFITSLPLADPPPWNADEDAVDSVVNRYLRLSQHEVDQASKQHVSSSCKCCTTVNEHNAKKRAAGQYDRPVDYPVLNKSTTALVPYRHPRSVHPHQGYIREPYAYTSLAENWRDPREHEMIHTSRYLATLDGRPNYSTHNSIPYLLHRGLPDSESQPNLGLAQEIAEASNRYVNSMDRLRVVVNHV